MLIKKDGKVIGQTYNLEKFLEGTGLKKEDIEIIYTKQEINQQRDKELKLFIIDNVEMNEDIIYKMSVKYNTASNTDKIKWIDADNKVVEFNKADFGALIKKGAQKVEEIYFKYRRLKDKALQEAN